jgi:hypothetical protein
MIALLSIVEKFIIFFSPLFHVNTASAFFRLLY